MDLIRTYLDKQSTLIYNNQTNNSKNPVLELVRGKNLYSRYIFNIDLTELRNKINNNGLKQNVITKHLIKFYSTINYREDLIGKTTVNGFNRDSSYTLQLFNVPQYFNEGLYFDYVYSGFNELTLNEHAPNWYYRTKTDTWSQNGIFTGTTTGITTQYFEQGNENIEMDITSYVNNILYNTTGNTLNLGISYISTDEQTLTGETKYLTSFFAKETQTFFEPCLETTVNSVIIDDRNKFYLDKSNNLYFNVNRAITSVNNVKIYDYEDNLILTFTGNSITQIDNKNYGINLTINSNTYPDLVNFRDVWNYTVDGVTRDQEQEFTLLLEDIFNDKDSYLETSKFSFSTYGIKNGEDIRQNSGIRKIEVITKRLYNNSITENNLLDTLFYRLYVLQGDNEVEIIPLTQISKYKNGNYFDIDIDSLIPKTYYLDIKVTKDNIVYGENKIIKFNVKSLL